LGISVKREEYQEAVFVGDGDSNGLQFRGRIGLMAKREKGIDFLIATISPPWFWVVESFLRI